MLTLRRGGSVPSYFTLESTDPTLDLQHGNMLCATLRKVKGIRLAACVQTHEVEKLIIEIDAPEWSEAQLRSVVRESLLLRAQQLVALLISLESSNPGVDAEDTRVFVVAPRVAK